MRSALAAVAIAASLGGCSAPAPSPSADPGRPLPSPMPEIVARVNGEPIRIHQILPLAKAELDRASLPDRDRLRPQALRRALDSYVERELLLQEALGRGLSAEARDVEWEYDQMRREHPDEAAWAEFLAGQGLDPQRLRAELRAQRTVAALVAQEKGAGRDPAALAASLRAKARVELFL